jgi:hypothetical protein
MLDDSGRRLLTMLVAHLPTANVNRPDKMMGYKDAHLHLGLQNIRGDWAESLKAQGLDNLAHWTKDDAKPGITAIIVNQESFSPGAGFFKLFGRKDNDFDFWREQVEAAKKYDWTSFLSSEPSGRDDPEQLDQANDLDVAPSRVETTTLRIIRDTNLSRRIKVMHKFECQICGLSIELSDGKRYAEAHHIKPLGQPHNGPDIAENIVCLCPNHHAEMDLGARPLELKAIRQTKGHTVDQAYLDYHNSIIFDDSRH